MLNLRFRWSFLIVVDISTMMIQTKSVYYWMNTRFRLLSNRWSISKKFESRDSHYFYLIRLSSIYLIDKIFRSYTDITRKWWNRLFVLNNLFILNCSLINSFCSCCRSQIDDICVNQLRQSLTRVDLRHCIDRICVFINSSNFRNLSSFVCVRALVR